MRATKTGIAMSIVLFIAFLAVLIGTTAAVKVVPYAYNTHMLFVFQVCSFNCC